MPDTGLLIVLCGPSGVGKTTLARRLMAKHPAIDFSVSYTTRSPRDGEREGVDYNFVDVEAFEAMREEGAFAEWARVHGNFYGTARSTIEEAWRQNRDVIFDIDYQGARQLDEAYPVETVSILVTPPSLAELEDRLRSRGTDAEDVIVRRLDKARHELAVWRMYDYVVENDDLDRAAGQIASIFEASRLQTFLHAAELQAAFGDADE